MRLSEHAEIIIEELKRLGVHEYTIEEGAGIHDKISFLWKGFRCVIPYQRGKAGRKIADPRKSKNIALSVRKNIRRAEEFAAKRGV